MIDNPERQLASPVEKARRLINHLRIYRTTEECLVALDADLESYGVVSMAFVNAHGFNLVWEDEGFASDIFASSMVLRDGKGMEMLFQRMAREPGANLNGTDLIPLVLERYRGRSVAILGTQEPWLGRAVDILTDQGIKVVLHMDGFQPEADYLRAVDREQPEIVLLAMGMPRQERVARLLAEHDGYRPALTICGGAIVDFIAGRVSRAPRFMRDNGLEWLFRLMQEPRRLFQRNIAGNVKFMRRMARVVQSGKDLR